MFSKLLKYELKSVGKWYFALNALIIAISFFLGFSIKTLTDYAENYTTSNANHYTQLIPIILAIMFGVVVASAWIATLAIIVRRFYKNIFGREGYLTLTLPVSTHQIILSKLIASLIWTAFNTIVVIIGVTLLVIPIFGLGHFLAFLPQFAKVLTLSEWGIGFLWLAISSISGILLIYLAITIGQLFANRRGLMAFVAYFVVSFIILLVSEILGSHELNSDLTIHFFIYSCIECFIEGAIFYLATHYLLKNKINIQ
ncbi:MAG: ABC transporter permease [Streptococcus infantarius]|nr:ABC transporter permease [Streptococcus infantarius]